MIRMGQKKRQDAAVYDRFVGRGLIMNIIVFSVLMAALFVLVITVKFGYEIHANNKRIRNGEAPKKYGDATDIEIVNVIDWTRR